MSTASNNLTLYLINCAVLEKVLWKIGRPSNGTCNTNNISEREILFLVKEELLAIMLNEIYLNEIYVIREYSCCQFPMRNWDANNLLNVAIQVLKVMVEIRYAVVCMICHNYSVNRIIF